MQLTSILLACSPQCFSTHFHLINIVISIHICGKKKKRGGGGERERGGGGGKKAPEEDIFSLSKEPHGTPRPWKNKNKAILDMEKFCKVWYF